MLARRAELGRRDGERRRGRGRRRAAASTSTPSSSARAPTPRSAPARDLLLQHPRRAARLGRRPACRSSRSAPAGSCSAGASSCAIGGVVEGLGILAGPRRCPRRTASSDDLVRRRSRFGRTRRLREPRPRLRRRRGRRPLGTGAAAAAATAATRRRRASSWATSSARTCTARAREEPGAGRPAARPAIVRAPRAGLRSAASARHPSTTTRDRGHATRSSRAPRPRRRLIEPRFLEREEPPGCYASGRLFVVVV